MSWRDVKNATSQRLIYSLSRKIYFSAEKKTNCTRKANEMEKVFHSLSMRLTRVEENWVETAIRLSNDMECLRSLSRALASVERRKKNYTLKVMQELLSLMHIFLRAMTQFRFNLNWLRDETAREFKRRQVHLRKVVWKMRSPNLITSSPSATSIRLNMCDLSTKSKSLMRRASE